MKKKDIFFILIIIFISITSIFFMNLWKSQQADKVIIISINGKADKEIPLNNYTAEEFKIQTTHGWNTVTINNGEVNVINADCPDHVCVKTKPASEIGEMIVCLPHKLIIEIMPKK